jgi:hypothetical protein
VARLFNAYVMVDWSAASAPKQGKDSIWIGVIKRDIRFRNTFEAVNPATREAAMKALQDILADLGRRNEKALIGFDFALGYPAGAAAMLKLKSPDWKGMWDFLGANVVDKPNNVNNRFAVAAKMNRLMTGEARPFWGCPANDAQTWLSPTKPTGSVEGLPAQLRAAELATQGRGKAGAKSVWQIFGNGTVGSQAIVGIPRVRQLRNALGDKAKVWPYETGWRPLTPDDVAPLAAVIAEVYPPTSEVKPEPGEVPDRAQVRALCEHFAKLDETGKLAAAFGPATAASMETAATVETEEGWILGA